ncbi:hypothetical protein JTE90_025349 [Oedothorax gibbosus]|uniref:BTB domain-containing protein n=1 Tax=Oedothorax gibbosus TaxID=931172 RepID=A0AAV6TV93_9ARAC|nr:hypothetical protein JTE90_025349 [Oedothorax gibbosus]
MGVSASSHPPLEEPPLASYPSVPQVDQWGKPEKKKGKGLSSTLRKRFARRRRAGKGYHDHAQVFRDLIADWSPRDVVSLVEEYEATSALKEITLQAEAARPPASTCKRDLGTLFQNRYCSDINLIYQGTVFSVHRAILAARCPFFREMLNSLSSVCTEVAVDIDIAGVSTSMFGELLRYLYTGELALPPSGGGNFDVLYQLSEQFGIPNPLEQDLRYLLETGIYSDVSLSFTSPSDATPSVRGQTAYVCDHVLMEAEGKPCKICHGPNEFWCHRAILSARSPFFRNVIHRQQRREDGGAHRTRILLDDSVIPRRYACILLRAVYQDALEFGAPSASSRDVSASEQGAKGGSRGEVPQSAVEEAMQLHEVARFIEMDALVQSCEDFLVESLSLESLLSVLRWSSQPHGSAWVYRQAVHFMREEFMGLAASPLLCQLEKQHLVDVLKSDFLQAGELEVLQAVLKWGEHQLFKRVEEREPNLVSHTAHSVARRGLRRRDLSDGELRELLSDLLGCVRVAHVLPQDSEVLLSCVRRGLVSTPPPHMLGDDLGTVHKPPRAWVRGRNSHGLYVKPRLFTPFVEEAKAWLEEQLGSEAGEVVRGGHPVWHMSHIPDALYMVEKPLSFSEGLITGHLCPPPHDYTRDLVLDEPTLRAMKHREKELRASGSARRAYAVVRNHCDVTKLLQLRVVREFGLPDRAMELLHRTSYQALEEGARYKRHHDEPPPPPPVVHQPTHQMSRSCCSDHLNELMPDIAMATSLLEQLQLHPQEPPSPSSGGAPFSLRMF